MDEIKLKPCPICGKKVSLRCNHSDGSYYVDCPECRIGTGHFIGFPESAVDFWNEMICVIYDIKFKDKIPNDLKEKYRLKGGIK